MKSTMNPTPLDAGQQLLLSLLLLDCYLTGRDPLDGRGIQHPHEVLDLEAIVVMGWQFYLSDGGYSRVFFRNPGADEKEWSIFLLSGARDEVKERWHHIRAQTLRWRAEAAAAAWYAGYLNVSDPNTGLPAVH